MVDALANRQYNDTKAVSAGKIAAVEHDARRYREQTIVADLLIGSPKDIFPARSRDFPGCSRVPTTPRLVGALVLNLSGFIRRTGELHEHK